MQTLTGRAADVNGSRSYPFYYKWFFLVFSIIFLYGWTGFDNETTKIPKAVNGTLDLSDWSFSNATSVPLDGEWSFYWQQLITPDSFKRVPDATLTGFIDIPRSWKGFRSGDQVLSANGYGTFRLRVVVRDPEIRYAIRLSPISTSFRMWVDGQEVAHSGTVAETRSGSIPKYRTGVFAFAPKAETVDITIQVANFEHRRGGLWTSLYFGPDQPVMDGYLRMNAVELIIVGSLLMIGFHHLGHYLLRREERAPLYFGLFCTLSALRTVFVGNALISRLVPELTWTFGIRLEYLATYIGVPLFCLFIGRLFPGEMNARFRWWISVLTGILSLIVLTSSPSFFTKTLWINQLITAVTTVYLLVVLTRAIRARREGAVPAGIGAFVFILTVVNDILYYNEVIRTGDYSAFGLLFFVIMYAFIISSKSAKAFKAAAVMSHQLKEMNSGLEAKIKERTDELEQSLSRLESIHTELARIETSRRRLLSNISHDLGTPMTLIQGYVEALLDRVVETPEQQHKYLSLIHSRVLGLNRLISDLFELSKLESRQIGFHFQQMEVDELIAYVNNRYEFDIINAGLHYALYVGNDTTGWRQRLVRIDLDRINQVLTNIIYNAAKHTPAEGQVNIRFGLQDEDKLRIEIEDSGSGIEPEDMPYIFDRFYKKDKSRNTAGGGSGLGLAIAKEIVEFHGGNIGVTSIPKQGSTFFFTLPLFDKNDR